MRSLEVVAELNLSRSFRFSAVNNAGTFILFDSATKQVLLSFTWPTGAYQYGINIVVDPPATSTKSGTKTKTVCAQGTQREK